MIDPAVTDMQMMESSHVRFTTNTFTDSASRIILQFQSFPPAAQKAKCILL